MKDSNSLNNSITYSNNNNNTLSIQNNKINELYEIKNNANDLSKKNLNELFNNAKNDKFLCDENKRKKHLINNNGYNKTIIKNKNYNLQISRQIIYSSPSACAYTSNNSKPKKIFECSGSSSIATTYTRAINKSKRFRKNNEQIIILKKFYDEHKHWSKNQIREISQKCGLKENKVYKWLWDQRNKEMKSTKFVVKKGNSS